MQSPPTEKSQNIITENDIISIPTLIEQQQFIQFQKKKLEHIQTKIKNGEYCKAFEKVQMIIIHPLFKKQSFKLKVGRFRAFFYCLKKIFLKSLQKQDFYTNNKLHKNLSEAIFMAGQILDYWMDMLEEDILHSQIQDSIRFKDMCNDQQEQNSARSKLKNKILFEDQRRKALQSKKKYFEEYTKNLLIVAQIKLSYEMQLGTQNTILKWIKQIEKICSFFQDIFHLEFVLIQQLGNIHNQLGNFYFQIQDFSKAIEYYEKSFDFISEEIQQKGEQFFQQKGDSKKYLISVHHALSNALKQMVLLLINMSMAFENNGDFQRSLECTKLGNWFIMEYNHELSDSPDLIELLQGQHSYYMERYSSQLREMLEVRRILDDHVVQDAEDQSKKENYNLTGKQIVKENEDYLELFSDYIYQKFNYDQLNKQQVLIQKAQIPIQISEVSKICNINNIAKQDQKKFISNVSYAQTLYNTSEDTTIKKEISIKQTPLNTLNINTLPSEVGNQDIQSDKPPILERLQTTSGQQNLLSNQTSPIPVESQRKQHKKNNKLSDIQSSKSLIRQQSIKDYKSSHSSYRKLILPSTEKFKPKLITSAKYWENWQHKLPLEHLTMLSPQIQKQTKMQEIKDQQTQQKIQQYYIKLDDYFQKEIYQKFQEKNKNQYTLPFYYVCDGMQDIKQDEVMMKKEVENSMKQLKFKLKYNVNGESVQLQPIDSIPVQKVETFVQIQNDAEFFGDQDYAQRKIKDIKEYSKDKKKILKQKFGLKVQQRKEQREQINVIRKKDPDYFKIQKKQEQKPSDPNLGLEVVQGEPKQEIENFRVASTNQVNTLIPRAQEQLVKDEKQLKIKKCIKEAPSVNESQKSKSMIQKGVKNFQNTLAFSIKSKQTVPDEVVPHDIDELELYLAAKIGSGDNMAVYIPSRKKGKNKSLRMQMKLEKRMNPQ